MRGEPADHIRTGGSAAILDLEARLHHRGPGHVVDLGRGRRAIRSYETEIAPDGTRRRTLRYEALGACSKKAAETELARKIAGAGDPRRVARSRVSFRCVALEWMKTVLPMYKHSTRQNHQHILEKHLLPRFEQMALCDLGVQDVQAYVASLAQRGDAPKTIDHIHDVLSALLRTAVKWGHLQSNPARETEVGADA